MENVNVVIVDDNPMILNTLDEVISLKQDFCNWQKLNKWKRRH